MAETPERPTISRAEYNRRLAARKKKRRRKKIRTGIIALLILAIMVVGIVLICKSCSADNSIEGIWIYDESTHYCFNEDGTGCMGVGNDDYEYTYTVKGNTVSINFVQDFLHDCKYIFKVKGDTLTLIGGEGTVGGEYELRRSDTSD